MVKIWIFNHYATAPHHVGGTRHFDIAKSLCQKGYSVTIFASSFNHFSKTEFVFKEKDEKEYAIEFIEGVRFIWINTPKYSNSLRRIKNILSYTIKAYKRGKQELKHEIPDLIIGSSVHPLAAVIGYLISKKTNSKFYFEERDLWPQTFVDFGKMSSKHPLAILLYKLESFLYKKADRIIVLFDKAKSYVESRGILGEKVIYLPNGVNMQNYEEINGFEKIDEIYEKLNNKFVVIYAGSHGIANHLDPIIELFSYLQDNKNIHLLMVGNGEVKKSLLNKVRKEDMTNITFIDSVPKSHIPYLLSKAKLGIISILDSPLYKWGFSMNKLYDYMAAGLPIVMIANPELAGPLREQKGIHVSQNLEELVTSINELYLNPDMVKIEGKSLKLHAAKSFSWETLGEKLGTYLLEDLKGNESDEKKF